MAGEQTVLMVACLCVCCLMAVAGLSVIFLKTRTQGVTPQGPCPSGSAWDVRANTCTKVPATKTAPVLLPWPTSTATPFDKLVNAYKSYLKNTHKLGSQSVDTLWGLYHNSVATGGDGLCYILRRTSDVREKIDAYAQSWLRATQLVKKTDGRLSAAQVKNLQYYISIPSVYGGLCPIVESDLPLGAVAGAFASTVAGDNGLRIPVVASLFPIKPHEVPAGNTIADKRFGIVIHEMSHVACSGGSCSGMDLTGHGGEQVVVDTVLRKIAAEAGLKPPNPNE